MTLSKKYRRLKNAGHILFWISSIVFALIVFYIVSDYKLGPEPDILIRAVVINTGFAFAVYTNFYLLIPRFLKKKNYIFYLFWLLVTLTLSAVIIIRVERFVTSPLPHRPGRAAFPHPVPRSLDSLRLCISL